MTAGKCLQFAPAAALLSGSMASAAQQQQILPASEGESLLIRVAVHPLHNRCVFQRQHIGTVLIQLHEVAAMLVQQGKVGGDDDLFRRDPSVIRYDLAGLQLQHLGVLVNVQPSGDVRREFERMKLCLFREPHGPDDREC